MDDGCMHVHKCIMMTQPRPVTSLLLLSLLENTDHRSTSNHDIKNIVISLYQSYYCSIHAIYAIIKFAISISMALREKNKKIIKLRVVLEEKFKLMKAEIEKQNKS